MSGFSTRQLGKTGLRVSPLGIGGGWGISSQDLLYAFERGINYYFFSSDMHHFAYRQGVEALRQLCGAGSRVRDRVVLATVSYLNDPAKLPAILMDQFSELGIDYIDIFHWGWITDASDRTDLLQGSRQLQAGGELAREYRRNQAMLLRARAQEVNGDLLRRGLARYVGASFHSRLAARAWLPDLDVLMVRYNLAHLGAELDLFPYLSQDKESNPGIVAFNVAQGGAGPFPPQMDAPVPPIPERYRFALSNPQIDLVLAGLRTRDEIDQALAALEQGPLDAETCACYRRYAARQAPASAVS